MIMDNTDVGPMTGRLVTALPVRCGPTYFMPKFGGTDRSRACHDIVCRAASQAILMRRNSMLRCRGGPAWVEAADF